MLREGQSSPLILRQDYAPPAYWIDTVDLCFDLEPAKTRVLNKMAVRRNPDVPVQPLRLDGEELNLSRVLVNGQAAAFKLEGNCLVLENLPDAFELEIFTTCYPAKNTKLMGLFVSQNTFFTQCEAEGFRRITYFLDRPDVMATFSVMLRADRDAYPVLLSNGNLQSEGDLDGNRHYARWIDPFKKPCYLFALVAGQLVCREQRITARSGSSHLLQVYVRPGDLDKTEHAMQSLVHSIVWDEARFNLPLDLERFMIVATSDFNMGAMENKGLNIFNTKYVLANQATATDADFGNIESVVGHEYFHNWTGNRITCRDWFQLSLKEGLTVFRDQEFSQDLCAEPSARAVKRIEDVRVLRTAQFAEDAGPMAHPVRPDSYVEISNFYTVTIYEKGAEVVRMMQTLVGRQGFADGMALYFKRHDGQAVTCDDFAQAIGDANPASELAKLLPQFKRWYSQAGTPRLKAAGHYDAENQRYTLDLAQHCPATPDQPVKAPFVIPVLIGLLDAGGKDMALHLEGAEAGAAQTRSQLLVLSEAQHSFVFTGITSQPTPSILRGFTAPVVLEYAYTDAELLHLLAHDSDPFNRWEAGQRIALQTAIKLIAARAGIHWAEGTFDAQKTVFEVSEGAVEAKTDETSGITPLSSLLEPAFIDAMRQVLRDPKLDAAFKELVLTLPSESYIAEQLSCAVDPQRIHAVRQAMRLQLACDLQSDWEGVFTALHEAGAACDFATDPVSTGRRALAGLALGNLCLAAAAQGSAVWPGKALQCFKDASNMTDRINALGALVTSGHPLAAQALKRFHAMFKNEALVIDKWFSLQVGAPDTAGNILPLARQLMQHSDFSLRNPNRARSVISVFCANPAAFHRADGAGYAFWKEQVIALDAINPQVGARLARALDRWRQLDEPYRSSAKAAIADVLARSGLSRDTREVLGRAMAETATPVPLLPVELAAATQTVAPAAAA